MKMVKVSLPDKLAIEVENYVKYGWFTDEEEVIRTSLQEFIRHNRPKLMEQFLKEDIEWALNVKLTFGNCKHTPRRKADPGAVFRLGTKSGVCLLL